THAAPARTRAAPAIGRMRSTSPRAARTRESVSSHGGPRSTSSDRAPSSRAVSELAIQRAAIDAEHARGPRHVPADGGDDLADVRELDLRERQVALGSFFEALRIADHVLRP